MKNLFSIVMKAALTLVAFAGLQIAASAQAQTKEVTHDFDEFTAIDIAQDFDVTLNQGDAYNITLTVDEVLSPYLSVHMQGKTLFVSFESKSVPKDVQKLYKGAKAPKPMFHAVITMPTVDAITLADNVVLNSATPFECPDKFELNLRDKAQVKLLTVSARSANLVLQKNTSAVMNVNTENTLEVSTDGSAVIRLTSSAGELVANAAGSSKINVTSVAGKLNLSSVGSSQVNVAGPCSGAAIVTADGSSKVSLSGSGESLTVKGSKSSSIDAYGLEVNVSSVELSGNSNLSVNAAERIDVNLTGGKLSFGGSPSFKVIKVSKATITAYGSGD